MKAWTFSRLSPALIAMLLATSMTPACSDDEGSPADGTGGGTSSGGKPGTGGMNHAGMDHGSGGTSTGGTTGTPGESLAAVESKAADLRVTVNLLLSEHLILAAKATGAALGGRTDEFSAYGALLNTNGTDIGDFIGSLYGEEAKDSFNEIWSAHNGFFVDYTTGVATGDDEKKAKAVEDLTTIYVPQFAALVSDATGLPLDAVTALTTEHVLTTKEIVDLQATENWSDVYDSIRHAFAHMRMLADPLSVAIAGKFPEQFPGDVDAKSVDFRVALNQLLQEHLFLASFATGAALGGRTDEFMAAGTALNTNGTDIGDAIDSLYGEEAKDRFNEIWTAHNGFFVDYTTGVATGDAAKKSKAVSDLTETYVPDFAEFLAGATDLPEDALASLTAEHVMTTADVVDKQKAGDAEAAANADRHAGQHMVMVGDPLAKAIVKKLPSKF
jgi:hypothetical protein